jgi:hypothetical protein
MSYIDAGYGIALAVLSGYAVQLWWRRRRLERLAARVDAERAHGDTAPRAHGDRAPRAPGDRAPRAPGDTAPRVEAEVAP